MDKRIGVASSNRECGCRCGYDAGYKYRIFYCPLHAAAPALLEALERIVKLTEYPAVVNAEANRIARAVIALAKGA